MDGRKREPRHGPDRVARPTRSGLGPEPARRDVPGRRRRLRALGFLAAVAGLGSVLAPVPGTPPARAQTGCGATLTEAQKTTEGLPHGSAEASGLVSSRRYPDVAWMVQDSGHPASLYALRFGPDGAAEAREIPVAGATNKDWEDIAYGTAPDGSGLLWVVESGQGGSGGRVVYEIAEPDPHSATSVRPRARYRYSYPDRSANTEASFVWDNQLVLVTKNFPARVYRFDTLTPEGVNEPRFVGELFDSNGISVAKPSPDGRWLITATHEMVSLYRNDGAPGTLEGFMNQEPFDVVMASPDDNVEAGDFHPAGECHLVLLAETRNTYRLASSP